MTAQPRIVHSLRLPALALAALVGILAAAPARATTYTWWSSGSTGSAGGTGTWDTSSARWTADGSAWVPWTNLNTDAAYFGGTAGTVTLNTGITLNALTFATDGYLITGNTLTLAGSSPTLTANTGVTGTIASSRAGSAGMTKAGAGTVVLTGNSTFTGNTTISTGTLKVTGAGGYLYNASNYNNTDVVTVNTGGTLELDSFGYGSAGGLGALASYGARRVLSGGTINIAGNTQSSGNNFQVANGSSGAFNMTTSGQTLTLAGNGNDNIKIGGALTFGGAGNITVTEVIENNTGAGSIVKSGAGTLTFGGANTYSGNTTVNSGTLVIGSGGVIYSGGYFGSPVVTVNSGATLDLQNWQYDQNNNTTSLGGLTANASGMVVNNGTIRISGLTATSYGRGVTVNSGGATLEAGPGANWTIDTVTDSQAWVYSGNPTITLTGSGTGAFNKVLGNGSGGLVKSGSGKWTLAGTNTYTGATTITGGTLAVSADLNLGAAPASASAGKLVLNGGVLAATTGFTLASNRGIALGPASGSGTGTIDVASGQTLVYGGIVANNTSGTGGLTKSGAGSLQLNGVNTFTGPLTISSGTLEMGGSGVLTSGTFTATITNSGTLLFTSSANQRINGPIDGTGAITWSSSGVFYRTGTNTYSGTTTIGSSGYMELSGGPLSMANSVLNVTSSNSTRAVDMWAGKLTVRGLTGTGIMVANGSGVNGPGWWSANNPVGLLVSTPAGESYSFGGTLNNGSWQTAPSLTIEKAGDGTQTFSGNNGYTGGTLITAGTMVAASNNALGTGGTVTLNTASTNASNATLLIDVSGSNVTIARAITVANQGSGTATLGSTSTGAANQAVFSGAVTLNKDVTLSGGASLDRTAFSGGIGGTGNVTVAGPTRVMFLSTANTYTGTTTINAGATLQLSDTTATSTSLLPDGTVLVANGTLNLAKGANGETIGGLTGSGTVQGQPGVANIASAIEVNGGQSQVFSGVLADGSASGATLSFTKSGSGLQILSGNNTYTGATTITGGTLSVASDSNLGTAPGAPAAGRLVINGGALAVTTGFTLASNRGIALGPTSGSGTGTIDVASGQTLTYGGIAADNGGTGSLAKTGAGTLILSGTSTYSGNTTIAAGLLQVSGSLASSVTVSGGATLAGTGAMQATTVAAGGVLSPGVGGSGMLTLGSITFSGSGTVNVGANVVTGTPSTLLNVLGNVTTLGSGSSVAFAFANLASITTTGTYSLITYSGTAPDASFFQLSGTRGARQGAVLQNGTQAVNLVITNAFPIWSGANSTVWTGSDNWVLSSDNSPTSFLSGDTVVFSDSAAPNGTVTLTGTVNPASTIFSGSTLAYTLSGGFGITTGALVKSGPATVTISTSNSFSGGTTLSAGTIRIGNDAALGTGDVTVSGTATGMTLSSDGGNPRTVANTLQLATGITLGDATNSGALTLTGTVNLNNGIRTITTPSNVTLSGLVTNGGLTKAGAGTLTIAGAGNNFTQGTTVSSGSLVVTGSAGLGSGAVGVSGGVLAVTGTGSVGSGAVTLSSGTILVGNDTALGSLSLTLNGGALASANTSARTLANALSIGGNVTLGDAVNTGTLTLGSGGVNLGGDTRQVTTPSNVTFAGAVTNGGITKLGAGTLTLSASNSYAAGTTLSAGQLNLNAASAIGTGTLTIAGASTLDNTSGGPITLSRNNAQAWNADFTFAGSSSLNLGTGAVTLGAARQVTITSSTLTVGGAIGGGFALTKAGAGTLVLSASNGYSGGTTLSAGTLLVGNASALGTGTVSLNGGTLDVNGSTVGNNVAVGGGAIAGNGGTLSGVVSDGAAQSLSVSSLTLTGTNTYSGATTIAGGTFTIGSAGQLGAGSYAGTISNAGTLAIATSANQVLAGGISGTGSLSKSNAGALTLSASNAFSGGITLSAGQLNVNHARALGTGTFTISGGTLDNTSGTAVAVTSTNPQSWSGNFTFAGSNPLDLGSGAVALSANRTITVTSSTLTVGGVISGAGFSLTKSGGGTLALTGNNSYSGGSTVSGGLLAVSGPTSSTGQITIGTGTVTVAGNWDNAANITINNGGVLTVTSGGLYRYNNGGDHYTSGNNVTVNTGGVLNVPNYFYGQSLGGLSNYGYNRVLNGGTINVTGNGGSTGLNFYVAVGGSGAFNMVTAGQTLTFGGDANSDILLGGPVTFGGAGNITVLENISNNGGSAGSIVMAGPATLTLTPFSGTNNYTGGTVITSGSVVFANGALGPSGAIQMNGGSLGWASGNTQDVSSRITLVAATTATLDVGANDVTLASALAGGAVSASLVKAGAGTLTLSGVNLYTGDTTISSGTLVLGGSGQLGGGIYAGAIANNGAFAFSTSANQTLSGAISGTGSLAKSGAGTLTLTGSNGFTGGITITTGTLQVGDNGTTGSLAPTAAVSGAAGATLAFRRTDTLTYGGTVGGAVNLAQVGSGTLSLTGANTYSGTTSLAAGVLSLGSAGAIGSSGTISFTGGTLQLTSANNADYSNRFSTGSGQSFSVDTNGVSGTFATGLTSSDATLAKLGSGTLALTGNSTFSGASTISAGVLQLGSGGSAGSVAGAIVNNATLAVNRSDAFTLANAISGTGGLVQAGSGTMTLSGANSYSGATTITGGVLAVSSESNLGTAPGSASPGSLVIDGGSLSFTSGFTLSSNRGIALGPTVGSGSGTINVASGQTLIYGGVLANNGGTGGLVKVGAGTLQLSGSATYSGNTSVDAGTLQVAAGASLASPLVTVASGATLSGRGTVNAVTVATGGLLAPGVASSGTLTTGTLSFLGESTVTMGVAGGMPTNLLNVLGDVTPSGGAGSILFAFGNNLSLINTGTYSLLTYSGTLTDTSAFGYTGTTGGRQSVAVSGTTVNGAVSLVVGNAFPIWTGTDGTDWFGAGNWKLNTTGSATNFQNNDTVEFNDLAVSGTAVISGSNATPASVTFSGNTKAITVSGTDGFGISTGAVVKSGSALVTITNANSYDGGTTISAGRIRVGDNSALGTGAVQVNGSSALSSDSGSARTLANGLHLDADLTLGDATDNGNLTISGTVTFDGQSRTITTPSTVTLSGLVTNGGLTKSGTGVLALTGSNNYGAGTTLSAGTLRVGNDAALGTGGVTLADGVTLSSNSGTAQALTNQFTINGNVTIGDATNTGALTLGSVGGVNLGGMTRQVTTPSDVTFAGTVTNGGLTKLGLGTLTLSASNSYSGGTTLSAGALGLGNVGGLGGGALTVSGNGTVRTALTGTIANAVAIDPGVTATFDATSGVATYSGVVSGSGGVAKSGAGTVVLSATSTYTGDTTISAGTLEIGGAGRLSGGSYAGAIANSGTFAITSSANQTISGAVSGVGSLTKSGAGTLTLSGSNSYSAGTELLGGTLNVSALNGIGSGYLAIKNGATFTYTGSGTETTTRLLWLDTGSSTISVTNAAGALTWNPADPSVRTAPFTKAGPGSLTIGGAFTSGASVTVNDGLLTLTASNNYSGGSTVAGGTLQIGAGGTAGSITGNVAINSTSAALVFNRSDTLSISGIISGTGNVRQVGTGTTTLDGSNTFTGTLTVAQGGIAVATVNNASTSGPLGNSGNAVVLGSSGAVGTLAYTGGNATSSKPFTLATGGTGGFDVQTAGATLTLSAAVAGSGGLAKQGAGTLTLTGANTFSGPVTISSGTLEVGGSGSLGNGTYNGAITNNGTLLFTTSVNPQRVLGTISGTGGLVSTMANALYVGGSNTYSGTTTIGGSGYMELNGGPLWMGNSVLNLTSNNGSRALDIWSGKLTVRGLTGTGIVAANGASGNAFSGVALAISTPAGESYSFGGTIQNSTWSSGVLQMEKTGDGTQILTGNNTFSGGAIIAGGTLAFATNGLGSSGALTMNGGALRWETGNTRDVSSRITLVAATTATLDVGTNDVTLASALAGGAVSGALVKNGAGTLTLSGVNLYTGDTTISSGTLALGGSGQLGGGTYAGAITNNGAFAVSTSANQTLSGAIGGSGSLTKSGAGTLTISGSNSYSGATTISGGTLALSGVGNLASSSGVNLSATGAGLDISAASGNPTVAAFEGAAGSSVLLGGNTLTADNATNKTFAGVISGSGGFTKAGGGNLSLTNLQMFTGAARVDAGTLAIGGTNSLAAASQIFVAEGATLDATAAGLNIRSGQLLGGYGLVDGNATSLSFASGATLSPGGSVGSLDGDFTNATLTGGMTYVFEVNVANGTAGGPNGWDLFTNTGAITLDASGANQILLQIASLDGSTSGTAANFDPTYNYAWKFLVAGSGNPITYQPNWFNVSATNFQNSHPGSFYVARGDELSSIGAPAGGTNELFVVYAAVPEPGTLALAGIGLAVAGWTAHRRRRTARRQAA